MEYAGRNAKEFYLKFTSEFDLTSAAQDIVLVEVSGIDGDLAMSNDRLKGVSRSFPCEIRLPPGKRIEEESQRITDWLRTGPEKWHDFKYAGDTKYVYKAKHIEEYSVQRLLSRMGRCVLVFRFKPIKYLISGMQPLIVANGQTINNTENTIAKPLITITGSGNITVNIGKSKLQLVGVDKGIVIDSQSKSVYSLDGQRPQWGQMVDIGGFPVIELGNQVITWTGNVTEMKIVPRLGAKL
ncbi:hypothetical protein I6N95_04975 [Vagococcus sp. BWB3-3]|uniref:Phage tail protein n=1 Tax=Vagococcus allomyrinae TaxID=2794353 RepID=A0A940SR32_9ENTE|nr:hypothetical protein [Vagococcus allomyrinae]MBP1040362.1 hypothetical protein [Vagococcus allomyrinae]